jgi:glyoxylase-like metal-dependent hydrolase (beta-lactamase superfamily II)
MSRVTSRQLGRFRLHVLDAGLQRLDGGAMFGVVPKPLWEKKLTPDERNRIPLAMRPLLVETDDELVLIDSGAGNKEDAKFRDIYGIENGGQPTALEDAIREAGYQPADVGVVINTHLHFDHAGGDTVIVQLEEWKFAHQGNERVRASYLLHNFDPVHEAGLFDFVEGDTEIPIGSHRIGGRVGALRRRPHPHRGPPAAPLDHGLRRGAAGHPGN